MSSPTEPAVELLTTAYVQLAARHTYQVALRTRWTWTALSPLIDSLARMLPRLAQEGVWGRARAWTANAPTIAEGTPRDHPTRDADWLQFLACQIPVALYALPSRAPYVVMDEPGPWAISADEARAWLARFSAPPTTADPHRTVLLQPAAGPALDQALRRMDAHPVGADITASATGVLSLRQVLDDGQTKSGVEFTIPVLAIWQAALLLAPAADRDRIWRTGLALVTEARPEQREGQVGRFAALWQALDSPALQPQDAAFWVACCTADQGPIREAALRAMTARTPASPPRPPSPRR